MKKLFLIAAIATLAGCSTYKDNAPSWMPGSNAIKVNLTGAEEVPPLSVPVGRKLTADQLNDLKNGNLYVNVHTAKNKGGEVRAQLKP